MGGRVLNVGWFASQTTQLLLESYHTLARPPSRPYPISWGLGLQTIPPRRGNIFSPKILWAEAPPPLT